MKDDRFGFALQGSSIWKVAVLLLLLLLVLGMENCGSSNMSSSQATAPKLVFTASSLGISAFTEAPTGSLAPVPGSPFSAGPGLAALSVHPSGSFLYASGYDLATGVGSVWAFAIAPGTGVLTPVRGSPYTVGTEPRTLTTDPTGKFLFVADFSQFGDIWVFNIDSTTGALTPITGAPFTINVDFFSLTIHPSGKFLYGTDSTTGNIYGYSVDISTGTFTPLSTSPFRDAGRAIALAIEPTGKYAYTADELFPNTVSGYSIGADGTLTPVPGSPFLNGGGPISITIDPSGKYVYTATSTVPQSVTGFAIDPATGTLTAINGLPYFFPSTGPRFPVSIAVDATSTFAYVALETSVEGFSLDGSGNLVPLTFSPYPTGLTTVAVATAVGKP